MQEQERHRPWLQVLVFRRVLALLVRWQGLRRVPSWRVRRELALQERQSWGPPVRRFWGPQRRVPRGSQELRWRWREPLWVRLELRQLEWLGLRRRGAR